MNEFNFHCDKCPRTFKLEEFYEKHKKVHDLKKQHRCGICGFVYGAAKGLEGHLKTHTDIEIAAAEVLARGMAAVRRQRVQPQLFEPGIPPGIPRPAGVPGCPWQSHSDPQGTPRRHRSLRGH